MAMIMNKMLRVIPKKQKITTVNCHEICTNLAKTGGELWEKVIYYINEENNCLDIKYKSRKGKGELGIENRKEEFDIWVISNGEGGPDFIQCLNYNQYDLDYPDMVNLYRFDEVRIKGDHKNLIIDLYPEFFHFSDDTPPDNLKKALQASEGNLISFKFEGIYTAGTIYQVGEHYSSEPELVSKEEFFRPRMVSYWEAQFLFYNHYGNYAIQKFLNSCLNDKLQSFDWNREHLHEIHFCYKNRIVKQIKTGQHWFYFNSEFFDNTVERNWIEYMALYSRGLV